MYIVTGLPYITVKSIKDGHSNGIINGSPSPNKFHKVSSINKVLCATFLVKQGLIIVIIFCLFQRANR